MNEATPDVTETKRSPGRPPNAAPKKGKPTWQPANVVDVIDKEPGYRYRLIEKSQRNLAKKQQEGWEILSGLNAVKTTAEIGYGRINDGKPLTSVHEGMDYVVGRMPEEIAEERDAYVNAKTKRMTDALRKQTQEGLNKSDAPIHGSITMEKRGVRTVIKE